MLVEFKEPFKIYLIITDGRGSEAGLEQKQCINDLVVTQSDLKESDPSSIVH